MESDGFASLESQRNEIMQLMQTPVSVESVWYVVAEISIF